MDFESPHRFCILAVAFLTACLSEDQQSVAQVTTSTRRPTRAPLTIDPAILRDRTFGEAPELAARVRRGDLPPVDERLPENPLVMTPIDTIGTYGGTIRRALTGDIVQTAGVRKSINENLMIYERPLPTAYSSTCRNASTLRTGEGQRFGTNYGRLRNPTRASVEKSRKTLTLADNLARTDLDRFGRPDSAV